MIATTKYCNATERVRGYPRYRGQTVCGSFGETFCFHPRSPSVRKTGDRTRLGRLNFPQNDRIPGAFRTELVITARVKPLEWSSPTFATTTRVNPSGETYSKLDSTRKKGRGLECQGELLTARAFMILQLVPKDWPSISATDFNQWKKPLGDDYNLISRGGGISVCRGASHRKFK